MRMGYLAWAVIFMGCSLVHAETVKVTLTNPAGDFAEELVRIKPALKTPYDSTKLVIKENGKEIPYQVEVQEGTANAVTKGEIWVCTTIGKGGTNTYEVSTDGTPGKFPAKVSARTEGAVATLANGLVSIRVPTKAEEGTAPAPILSISADKAPTMGVGAWNSLPSKGVKVKLMATVTDGPLFAKARLRYEFDWLNLDQVELYFYEATITVKPNQPLAHVEETFRGTGGWQMEIAKGWAAKNCLVRPNNDGGGPGGNSPGNSLPKDQWPTTLKTGQTRMGDTLIYLLPRWSQAFDDGWFFAAHDNTNFVAAIPARAGKWVWPHENRIAVKVKETADSAILELPTRRGSRYWLLAAGPLTLVDTPGKQADLVRTTTMQHLDKIVNEYISEWPGAKGGFQGAFFFGNDTNPTGMRRGMARGAIKDALAGKKGDLSTLFWAQVNLDPDWYGSYYTYWSPENPNFFTDFIKTPVAMVAQLRDHPRFPELRAMAEAKLREDMDHSITLPGGAGQECPGYLTHAVKGYEELAPVCKQYLGFDPTTWPRYKAAFAFQRHVSFPDGNIRRQNPAGDTHPGKRGPEGSGTAPIDMAGEDPTKFVTEELPGFGVIFRNNPGTAKETYLSFKAGPNRGHFHGDQLAVHLCFNAKPVAVDHHCSYAPRAGQEHMHNRVAFSVKDKPGFEYTNMDGYERLIAFKTGKDVDIAIAQVESPRLRAVAPLPPEIWDDRWRVHDLASPLIYRRTIVLVKALPGSGMQDYFVFRDQYWSSEKNLAAHYQLHVLGDKAEQKGSLIVCDGLSTFVARPEKVAFEKFEWEHSNGGREKTAGPRLTQGGAEGEFIMVLYPGEKLPQMAAIKNGVRVGSDEIEFGNFIGNRTANPPIAAATQPPERVEVEVRRGTPSIGTLTEGDVNFNRSQGDIGLFVPDAGYPFGPIPDWLVAQRTKVAKPTAKN